MKKKRALLIFICAVVGLIVVLFFGRPREKMRIHFLNVGYGDAILIQLPGGGHMLIDAGSQESAALLISYLKGLSVTSLDAAVLTHPHEDHFGGFPDLLDNFSVGKFYFNGDERAPHAGYASFKEKIKKKGLEPQRLREGDELFIGLKDVYIRVLHPSSLEGSTNENPLVIWARFKKTGFLFTSDIQRAQQDMLLERFPEILSADVVQLPHHGGELSERFVEFTRGKILVLSTGPNKYNKPDERGLARLNAKVWRTDQEGGIILESDGKRVEVIHAR